jgi:2-iminobutanoate/2-iminopropanoate deaminase
MMSMQYSAVVKRVFLTAGLTAVLATGSAFAQNKAVDFKQGMPFSGGFIAGNTLYVAGQQGRDEAGKLSGDIKAETTSTIAAIKKVVDAAGFKMSDIVSVTVYVTSLDDVPKMNEVYKALIPDPKPARATVQVAGLIGGAKIEISAIAVKQ